MTKKIVYIEWLDASSLSDSGWKTEDQLKEFIDEPFLIQEVGFIYHEDKDYLTLIGGCVKEELDWDEIAHRELKIPIGCIRKRAYLTLPKGKKKK